MLLLPRLDVIHPHLGVRIPPHPGPDIDDDHGDHESRRWNFGGRPALRAKVKGGIHMRPTMLVDVPRIGVKPIARNVMGVEDLKQGVSGPARKFRDEGMGQVDDMRDLEGLCLAAGARSLSNGREPHPDPT